MANKILADVSLGISELKRDPMAVAELTKEGPVVVLNRNEPVFYCVSPEEYSRLVSLLEDVELNEIANQRQHQERINVNPKDL